MKILNVSSSGGIGGREMLVMTLSDGLRAKGCEVRLLAAPGTWLAAQAGAGGYQTYLLPMRKYVDIYSIWRIGAILRSFQPDVVHLYFIPDIWLVVPAVKLFYPRAAVFLLRSMQSAPMRDWFRTRLFRSLEKIVVMSDFLRHDFLAQTKVAEELVETVYVGVDLRRFPTGPAGDNVLKREYRLDPDQILVGLVGRIDAGKGQDLFIDAAGDAVRAVGRARPELAGKLRFFVVGSSEKGSGAAYEQALKRRAQERGVGELVVFTGFREDVPRVMRSLDVAVFPSKNEAFGLVVIEAMAASRAVVGCRRGAFPEIIEHGVNGLVVDYDSRALGEGIAALVLDETLREGFGRMGRRTVESKFDLEVTLGRFLELYRGAGCGQGGAGAPQARTAAARPSTTFAIRE